jgi:hypothetical protein
MLEIVMNDQQELHHQYSTTKVEDKKKLLQDRQPRVHSLIPVVVRAADLIFQFKKFQCSSFPSSYHNIRNVIRTLLSLLRLRI